MQEQRQRRRNSRKRQQLQRIIILILSMLKRKSHYHCLFVHLPEQVIFLLTHLKIIMSRFRTPQVFTGLISLNKSWDIFSLSCGDLTKRGIKNSRQSGTIIKQVNSRDQRRQLSALGQSDKRSLTDSMPSTLLP